MINHKSGMVLLDAGTPLLWAIEFHLYMGNFFIGLAEYYLVKVVYKINLNGKGLVLLIVGNYVSMVVGLVLANIFKFHDGNNSFQTMLGPLTVTLFLSIII